MTERLTEKITNKETGEVLLYRLKGQWGEIGDNRMRATKKLGELETAEEEGRLVILPCKVGDIVYIIFDQKIYKGKCDGFEYDRLMSNWFINIKTPDLGKTFEIFEDIGKTIFFTKEEAEKALKEMKKNE